MRVKDWIFNAAVALVLALAMLGGWTVYRLSRDLSAARATAAELESDNREMLDALAEREATGGAEVWPAETALDLGTVFPVHEQDFLMLTSPYGIRTSPFFGIELWHTGVDIAAVWRAQVVSIADGVVVEHWPPPGTPHPGGGTFRGHDVYGGMVMIDHGEYTSLYAHMETTRVHTGQRVRAGDIIGRIGDTGMARGRHLHIEIHVDGEPVNPLHYIPAPKY